MGTSTNVIVGPAQVWIAPVGSSEPVVAPTTGLYTPTTPWVQVGFTEEGVSLNLDRKTNKIMVEEQSTPVVITTDTTDFTVEFSFAEDTVANMSQAYGGGTVSTVAASGSAAGYTSLALADPLTTVALFIVATNAAGFHRSIYIPEVVSMGKVKTSYRRAKAARSYPVSFDSICPPSSIVITDITAVET